jgi:preprotein translocase subunit YajC
MEGMGQWPLLIMMFLAFYFILIVPQTRRAKKEKKFISALKRGDRVVTKSGMHGKVIEVSEANNTCVIETMAGKIKFDKTAISLEMSSKLNKK